MAHMRGQLSISRVAVAACLAVMALSDAEQAGAESVRSARQATTTELARLNQALTAAAARRAAAQSAKEANAANLAAHASAQRAALAAHDAARAQLVQRTAIALAAARNRDAGQFAGQIAAAHARHYAKAAHEAHVQAEQAGTLAGALASEDAALTQASLLAAQEEIALEALLTARRTQKSTLAATAKSKRPQAKAPNFEAPQNIRAGWPAAGRVVTGYGRLDQNARAAKGVTLAIRAGATVVAPASGEIVYAGLFRSYGRLLIVQLANDYAIVLAGVEETHAAPGQRVQAGQPIARMPAGDDAGELYWEVRRNDRPIDPVLWARDTARSEANRKRTNNRRETSAKGAAR